jgi:undecaprenyl-diphosphatase
MPPHRQALGVPHAILLGLLEGPTELLPVSSSAHTSLVPLLAGWPYAELEAGLRKSFEVSLHAGAALALAIHARGELRAAAMRLDRRALASLALSCAPAACAGYALQGSIERRLGGPRATAAALASGALAMALADRRVPARHRSDATARDALAIGLAQAVALVPGISRSGAALTAARARGFHRRDATALCWRAACARAGAASRPGPARCSPRVPARRSARRSRARGCCAGAAGASGRCCPTRYTDWHSPRS